MDILSGSEGAMMTKELRGDIIQLSGLVVVGIGCGIELASRAAVWTVLITAGSVIFAIGTKLKGR